METKTLVIGFDPATEQSSLKPIQRKEHLYFCDVFEKHNFGDVYYTDHANWPQRLDEVHPIIVVVFDNYAAQKVKDYKADSFIYVFDSQRKIVRNKTQEAEDNKYKEIENLIKIISEKKDESVLRKVAAMDYKATYKMVKDMLLSEKPDLIKRAWEMLQLNHGDWPWMRAQLMMECWNHAKPKVKEEFVMIGVNRWLENGVAVQIEDIVDGENTLHQFKLNDGTIYRVLVATESMGKYSYEELMNKYNQDFRQEITTKVTS